MRKIERNRGKLRGRGRGTRGTRGICGINVNKKMLII